MSAPAKPTWERFNDALVGRCGYALLALATALGLLTDEGGTTSRVATLVIASAAAGWIYLSYTRIPAPRRSHQVRLYVFFAGLLTFASVLMLHQPVFFIFMISGFFYASVLRPLPLAVVGVGATSILVNSLISGIPTSTSGWTFYLAIIVVQTIAIGGGVIIGERINEQSEQRRQALAKLEAALAENAGLHAQLVAQAREAGILDERARLAREIHDTIAQGLIGIVTQLEAAEQARERPHDRDRYLGNAKQLARDSLVEARRSVEGTMPSALESRALPDALRDVARNWSAINGIAAEVTITGDVVALHPEIEVALLRTAQEALANVARHASARHAWLTMSFMGDVVALDVRDDGVGFRVEETVSSGATGFGLNGMRQRVARVAGSVAIESEPGGGTAISARVPAIAAGSSATAK